MERLDGTSENYMLNIHLYGTPTLSPLDYEEPMPPKLLQSPSSLLYEYLSMESRSQTLASPSRQQEENPADSLAYVTLGIPKALLFGCSELTISLPMDALSSDIPDTG